MGHRLSKITTRTGDDGTTGLADGSRVKKTNRRIEAIGTVDELNSLLGVLLTHEIPPYMHQGLTDVQNDLFDLGGELSIPGSTTVSEDQVMRLETMQENLNADLPPLKEFILPGGSESAALCHLARSVCRRAERRVIHLSEDEPVNAVTIRYLNRLSDLLFVTARVLNRQAGETDVLWKPGKHH
jgi:cob(I)alamin adenosyltransferase